MKNKPVSLIVVVVLIVGAGWVGRVTAGSLDAPTAPGSTSSYGLDDIYNRLDSGTVGTSSNFAESGSGPGSTMMTLNEIMGKAPALDSTNGATTTQVISGTTFWGLNVASSQWGVQTGTLEVASTYNGVPKTGVTATVVLGDDGDLEKGVAWPNPRFTDNTDGTVTDNLTGLIWLKDAGCMGARQWSHLSSATFGFISRLNGGEDFSCTDYIANTYSDWRLPNIRELFSLIRYGFLRPALPNTVGTGQWSEGDPFVGVSVSGNHWSSSTHAVTSGEVWHMDMAGGWVDHTGKTASFRVWPVRGGQ